MNKQQNQVRPRMSRENYEWLQSIEGETNDERIENLRGEIRLSETKIDMLLHKVEKDKASLKTTKWLNQCLDITGQEKIRMKSERDTFIIYLCVSMAVNFGLLGYIATLQGWF